MIQKWVILPFILLMSILVGCSDTTEQQNETLDNKQHQDNKTLTIGWPLDVSPLNPHTYLPNQITAQAIKRFMCE